MLADRSSAVGQWVLTLTGGEGVADLLRSTSLYRGLGVHTREPLLEAIPDRIPTRMDDRAPRRYLSVLRARKRAS